MNATTLGRAVRTFAGRLLGWPQLAGNYAFYPAGPGPTLDFIRGGNQDAPSSLSAVYRACALLADAAASLPWSIQQPIAGGGVQKLQTFDAARAMATMSYPDRELVAFQAALHGAGYARIWYNERNAPERITAIPAHRMTVLADTSGRVWYRVAPDASIGEEDETVLSAQEVAHLRFRSTDSSLVGTPPIATCAPALAAALSSRQMQQAIFENWALPGTVLTTEQMLSDAEVTAIRTRWEEAASQRLRGKTVMLGGGLKPVTLDVRKLIDVQAVEFSKFYVAEVSRIYGVPLSLLGEPGQTSYATAAEESRGFANLTLRPWLRRVSDAYAGPLLTRNERAAGMKVDYDLHELLLSPGNETSEYLSRLVNGGIITPNEARNLLQLPDTESGDLLRVPVNTQPPDVWQSVG